MDVLADRPTVHRVEMTEFRDRERLVEVIGLTLPIPLKWLDTKVA